MKRKPIPKQGIALREAKAAEWGDVIQLVSAALLAKLGIPPDQSYRLGLEGMYPDRVIVRSERGRYMAYPYSIADDNTVTLGEPTEVVETFVNVREAHAGGVFIEAAEGDSGRWLIRVIRAGRSSNGNFYPDAVLREAAPMFEGARVFIKSDAEHIKGAGKDVRNLIAGLTKPRFVEGAAPDTGEIQAELVLIEPDGDVATKLREAHHRDLSSLFGFSIDADGTAKVELREGKKTRVATAITKVNSVDLIVEPGAGGELIRLVEARQSTEEQDQMREELLKFLEAKHPKIHGRLTADSTDAEVQAAYREAVLAEVQQPPAGGGGGADALAEIRLVEARITARELIGASTLPTAAKEKLTARFAEAKNAFTADDVKTAIEDERKYLAKFVESGRVQLAGLDVEVEDRSVKVGDMLNAFFDPTHKDHRNVRSFKEAYIEITGDRRVTGQIEHCDRVKLRESLGANFREALDTAGLANVLGAALRRALIREYNSAVDYQSWRQIADVVPVQDFRTNERTRFGGFGDLPAVNQSAPYTELTAPTDEKASYAVSKRGGLATITLEAIKNDDVGAIQRVPQKLGRAAARTLAKFVFDFIRTNPVTYDGLALFHATHNNLFTGALSATEFAVHRLAMMKQTELNSADRLGIGPANILVPPDLQETAYNLFQRATNLDKTFVQSLVPTIIPVWYWTDVTDWATTANKADIPLIEVGFLDGQEEPELFVQDLPNVGSLFSNDQITYKLRHIYGGVIEDFRGFTKAVVAG